VRRTTSVLAAGGGGPCSVCHVGLGDLAGTGYVNGAGDRDDAVTGGRRPTNEFTTSAEVHAVVQVAGGVHGDINVVPGPDSVTPRQNAAPPVVFVNRDDVLSWLVELVTDASVPPRIVVLSGLPGVGKRAVARRFAHASRSRFPGGDLLADCEEYRMPQSGGVVDVSGMIGRCLRGLGVSDRYLPPTLGERRDLLRSRTADRPVLVVVENATEPAQVRALVPNSPGSVVLVTTTADLNELRLDGAVFRELGRLNEQSSAELFASTSGLPAGGSVPPPPDLVRFCAGLPIAILVLAARVARLHDATLDELTDELADEGRRLTALSLGGKRIVSAAFTAAYERLVAEAQHLYRRLGLFPGIDVSVETAAAAGSTDIATARRALGVLGDAHLLERRDGGRFGFHELVRAHARELAMRDPVEHREAAVQQIVRHYLVTACFADRAIIRNRSRAADHADLLEGRADPFEQADDKATAWLTAERANLAAIAVAAFDAGLLVECWQLAEALLPFFFNRRPFADWVAVSDVGARAARMLGEVEAEARLRISVSRAYTDLGDLARAEDELDTALRLAESHGDSKLLASVWEFKGRLLDRTDGNAALSAYERSRELNTEAREWRGVALTLHFQGCTLDALGRHEEALQMLRRALEMFRGEPRDGRMAARTLVALGSVLIHVDRLDEATVLLGKAVTALRGMHYEARAQELLADIATRSGDANAKTLHLRRACEIYDAEGNPRADRIRPAT
jgi:tetratricopeptide (TPR) repeat protein